MEFSFCGVFIDILGFIFYQCLLTIVTDFFKKKLLYFAVFKIILLKLWILGIIFHHIELLSLGIICDNEV